MIRQTVIDNLRHATTSCRAVPANAAARHARVGAADTCHAVRKPRRDGTPWPLHETPKGAIRKCAGATRVSRHFPRRECMRVASASRHSGTPSSRCHGANRCHSWSCDPAGTTPVCASRACLCTTSRDVSIGEPLCDGIGRPAPAFAEAGPRCRQLSVSTGAAPSLRPPGSLMPCVSGSAATFDTGPGAGGRASAFRTALGICPRPVVCHPGPRRHGLENPPPNRIVPAGRAEHDAAMISDDLNHCNIDKNRQSPPCGDSFLNGVVA